MSLSSKGNPNDVSVEAGKSKSEEEKKDENNDSLQTLPLERMHITDENEWMKKLPQKLKSIVNNLQSKDFDMEIGNLSTEMSKNMSLDMINKLAADLMTKISEERYIHELVLVRCMRDAYQKKESSSDELSGKLVRCLYMAYKIIDKHSKPFNEDELANIETILGRMLTLPSTQNNVCTAVYQKFLDSINHSLEKPENSDQGSTRSPTQTPQKVSETQKKVLETERETNPVLYSKTRFLENLLWEERAEACFAKNCLEEARLWLEKIDDPMPNKIRHDLMLIGTHPHTAKKVTSRMQKLQKKMNRYEFPDINQLTELAAYYKDEKKNVQAMAVTLCVYHMSHKDKITPELEQCAYKLISEMVNDEYLSKKDVKSMDAIRKDIKKTIHPNVRLEKSDNHAYLSMMGLIDCIKHAIAEKCDECNATLVIKKEAKDLGDEECESREA